MQELQRVGQSDADPNAFGHRQSSVAAQRQDSSQVPRFVLGRLLPPSWIDSVAEFHNVVKIAFAFLFAYEIDTQQAGVLVRYRFIPPNAVELAVVRFRS